jgi:hypothetical protein
MDLSTRATISFWDGQSHFRVPSFRFQLKSYRVTRCNRYTCQRPPPHFQPLEISTLPPTKEREQQRDSSTRQRSSRCSGTSCRIYVVAMNRERGGASFLVPSCSSIPRGVVTEYWRWRVILQPGWGATWFVTPNAKLQMMHADAEAMK